MLPKSPGQQTSGQAVLLATTWSGRRHRQTLSDRLSAHLRTLSERPAVSCVSLNLLCFSLVSQCTVKTGPVSCVGLRGRVPGCDGVGVVLTVSVWGVLTEFDDLSWTPEIEAASGQHGGCPEQIVGTVVAGFLRVVWRTPLTTRVILVL
jgi:hypothetical protein